MEFKNTWRGLDKFESSKKNGGTNLVTHSLYIMFTVQNFNQLSFVFCMLILYLKKFLNCLPSCESPPVSVSEKNKLNLTIKNINDRPKKFVQALRNSTYFFPTSINQINSFSSILPGSDFSSGCRFFRLEPLEKNNGKHLCF